MMGVTAERSPRQATAKLVDRGGFYALFVSWQPYHTVRQAGRLDACSGVASARQCRVRWVCAEAGPGYPRRLRACQPAACRLCPKTQSVRAADAYEHADGPIDPCAFCEV